ncbi:uncharacterized protein ACNS7B_000382 [Menidia menidia]
MPGRRSLHPDEPNGGLPADVQQVLVVKEEDPWIPSLDQQDPEGLNIKEEEDQLWTSPEEKQFHGQETDIRKFSDKLQGLQLVQPGLTLRVSQWMPGGAGGFYASQFSRTSRTYTYFGFMITGFLLIGVGGYLRFREIRRLMATGGGLPVEPVYRSINTRTQTLCELSRKHDALVSKLETQWSKQEAHRSKMGTICDSMKVMGNTLEKLVVRMDGN